MPDTRGFLVLGLFTLTTMIFVMMAINPKLAEVQLFEVLSTAIVTGGLGGAVGFYLGASKGGTDSAAVIAKQLDGKTPSP